MMALVILYYFLVVVHRCSGSDDITKLMKKFPTWSFEVKSVESLIEEAAPSFRVIYPDLSEASLRAKIKKMLPNTTHVARKSGDPKWLKKLPDAFDAREKWPKCAELIGTVEDEGVCHTDGPAVASAVASDRLCIHTDGAFKEKLSQQMLAACAESCTQEHMMWRSFNYIEKYGIPTGGGYTSKKGCLPYVHPPCKHDNSSYPSYLGNIPAKGNMVDDEKLCSEEMAYDHDCPMKCSNAEYSKSLDEDRRKFTGWYIIAPHEFVIRREILAYGPVAGWMDLYSDFFNHPEGIYWASEDAQEFYERKHIKLIGWGEENGTHYWLAVNTWDQWGPSKVFKIPRGIMYLDVEWFMMTGVYEEY